MTLSDEAKAWTTIHRHIITVQKHIGLLAQKLIMRATVHDSSKLSLDEFGGFVEVNRVAREHPYGSDEYKAALKDNKAIELHFSRNSHHPEFHKNGVTDMGLVDFIEMVCDWKAASEIYGQTSFEDALKIQIERFGLSDEHIYLVKLIAKELEL